MCAFLPFARAHTRGAVERGQDLGVFNMRQTSLTSPFFVGGTCSRLLSEYVARSLVLSLSPFLYVAT